MKDFISIAVPYVVAFLFVIAMMATAATFGADILRALGLIP